MDILKGRTRPPCVCKFSPLIIFGNTVRELDLYLKLWLQHLKRKDKNWIPKEALQYEPTGRRNIGRLMKRQKDQLHLEDQGTGTTSNPSEFMIMMMIILE